MTFSIVFMLYNHHLKQCSFRTFLSSLTEIPYPMHSHSTTLHLMAATDLLSVSMDLPILSFI